MLHKYRVLSLVKNSHYTLNLVTKGHNQLIYFSPMGEFSIIKRNYFHVLIGKYFIISVCYCVTNTS